MPKKNFYAVKGSLKPHIYTSWPECSRAVQGTKGAIYKGFVTKAEAEAFLEAGADSAKTESGDLLVYVDGSFTPKIAYAGWGFVVVKDGVEIHKACGHTAGPALSRNIDGELLAAMEAVLWAEREKTDLIILHDYEGIARWARGEWKASSAVARNYKDFMSKHKVPTFRKVSAHSGDKWNDVADELAKKGLEG